MANSYKEKILEAFPDLTEAEGVFNTDAAFVVPPEEILQVAEGIHDMEGVEANYLASLSGVDYKEYLEAVYHVFSLENDVRITLKVQVPVENPVIPSVTPVWPTAGWHEREAYDLVGIRFANHPDLRRILLMDRFEGHPLRKDFKDQRPKRARKVRPR